MQQKAKKVSFLPIEIENMLCTKKLLFYENRLTMFNCICQNNRLEPRYDMDNILE